MVENSVDLSVIGYDQVDSVGPLGGTSYVYRVRVKTDNVNYKSEWDANTVIEFEVLKTFSEFVDMQSKLQKKHAKSAVPSISKHLNGFKVTCAERLKALHHLMTEISKNSELVTAPSLLQFLEVDKRRKQIKHKKKVIESETTKPSEQISAPDQEHDEDFMKEYNVSPEKVTFEINNKSKQKEVKPLQPVIRRPSEKETEKSEDLFIQDKSNEKKIESITLADNNAEEDIFKEFKESTSKNTIESLFNDVMEPDSDLFSISKDEKPKASKINLFDDLDLGDRILKDEQHLFYLPENRDEIMKDDRPSVDLETEDLLRVDNLDDDFKKLEVAKNGTSTSTELNVAPKPTPRSKPVPAPRKSSLGNDRQSSPPTTKKPSIAPKPKIGPKPRPSPKPRMSPDPSKVESTTLSHLDINQYIEQQSQSDDVDLFGF